MADIDRVTDDFVPLHERPEIHARRWFLLGVMCLSLVMVVMAVSGLNVALPSIQRDLDATATDLQWIVDSYAIVFAGLLLTAGAMGDRFGRKRSLIAGLVVFAGGSLIGALASSPELVIVSRSVSGIGAAFVMPATLSLLTAIFPPHERGKAIAIWAGFAGAGGALGPLVVGLLLTGWWVIPSFWWGSAFVVNVVTPLLVVVAVAVWAPRSQDDEATPLDPIGAVLSLGGVAALLFGIIEGPARGWSDGLVVAGFVLGAALLVAFVVWELWTTHPMLPMGYFRDRSFSTGSGIITIAFLVMFGFFFLITLYFQFVKGYSPLRAGVATLPFAATMIAVSPRSEVLVARLGLNTVVGSGFVLMATGFGLLGLIGPTTSYWLIAPCLVVMSSGMAITMPPATGAIMASVPLNKAGIGSAVNDTTREFGGALGIAVLGSVMLSAYRSNIDASAIPPEFREAARESIGAAIGVAQQAGGDQAGLVVAEAGIAFTDAVNVAFVTAAVVALVAGTVVVALGRRS